MSNPYSYNAMVTDPNCITDPMSGNISVPQQFKNLSTSECQEKCGQWIKVNCPNTDPGEKPCQQACKSSPGPPTGLDGRKVYQNNCSHISVAGGNEHLLDDCCNTHCNTDPACTGDCVNASTGGGAPNQGCNPCTNLTSDELSKCCGASQEQVCMQMYKQKCPPGCTYNSAAGECMGGSFGPTPTPPTPTPPTPTPPVVSDKWTEDLYNQLLQEFLKDAALSPDKPTQKQVTCVLNKIAQKYTPVQLGMNDDNMPPGVQDFINKAKTECISSSPNDPGKPPFAKTDGNGGDHSKPISPKIPFDIPDKWTKDFYNKLIDYLYNNQGGDVKLTHAQVTCAIDKVAQKYTPDQIPWNDDKPSPDSPITKLMIQSMVDCTKSTSSDPGPPKFPSDNNTLVIVLVVVGVLLIFGGGFFLFNRQRHHKSVSSFY